MVVVYFGVLLSDLFIFHMGKKYGRKAITHRWIHRFLSPEKFSKLEEKFKRKGIYFLIVGRHLVGVRLQVILVSGIMKMPTLKFFIIDALTATVTITLWTVVGYGGGQSLHNIAVELMRKIDFLHA